MVNYSINRAARDFLARIGRLLAMSALSFDDVFNRSVEKFVENPPNITLRLNR